MENANNEYYKLSWRERLGFCSGDLAQNLIYQTVSIWLLFYYNNVYGLGSAVVAVMFLVVRIIDVLWDPWGLSWTSRIPDGANTARGSLWAAFRWLPSPCSVSGTVSAVRCSTPT